ncbi:OmpA family protein [Persicobacter diffluens]|uniref:OmpA-like domain-containing protein n=1 Tax=Persicobacter diffluens TaxID=981 RepID=A0AAN5AKX9_9BACT|nr:hypothetical protein PEDI_28290 [Persicobacter diffluens]
MRFLKLIFLVFSLLFIGDYCYGQSFHRKSIRHKQKRYSSKKQCKKGRKKKPEKLEAKKSRSGKKLAHPSEKADYQVTVVSTPVSPPKSNVITTPPPLKPEPLENKPALAEVKERILPKPINEDHARVRKMIDEREKNGKTPEEMVESLYFITGQDEFAYVNFDSFLIAVEYALRGGIVLVEGHTDSIGKEEDNLQLSMKRVRQIERLMKDIGVNENQISVIGYGESMPKYDNDTEEGRQKNRRVDFKIFMPENK